MRMLMAGVLLALWSSATPAQAYDTPEATVGKLTELLVLRAKVRGVEVEKGVYVGSCDFHERGGGPYPRLSKHLAGLFAAELARHGVRVVATQGEGEEMFLRAEWTREVGTGKLLLEPRLMRPVYKMKDGDRKLDHLELVTSEPEHVLLADIDGSHFEPDPASPCNPKPVVTSGRTPAAPGGNALDDVAEAFDKANEANTVAAFELVPKHFPGTYYAELAQHRADALKAENEAREAEAKRRAEAEARRRTDAEAKRKEEEEARRRAAAEAEEKRRAEARSRRRKKHSVGTQRRKRPTGRNAKRTTTRGTARIICWSSRMGSMVGW